MSCKEEPEPVAETIGRNIRALLTARGYKAYEKFALEYNIEKSILSKILRGKTRPRIDTMIRIAGALEVSLDEIYPMPRERASTPGLSLGGSLRRD